LHTTPGAASRTVIHAQQESYVDFTSTEGLPLARSADGASIAQYKRVVALDPNTVNAWIGLGIGCLHQGDKRMTRAAWEQVLRLDPARQAQVEPLIANLDAAPR
jgi:predicted TPR repeat methyltransferase